MIFPYHAASADGEEIKRLFKEADTDGSGSLGPRWLASWPLLAQGKHMGYTWFTMSDS
jgi:hypothetical protein